MAQQIDSNAPAFDESRTERIRQRAYELFQARGGDDGHDMDDWLTAEREEATATEPGEPVLESDALDSDALETVGGGNGEIRKGGVGESRQSDARTPARHVEERPFR
jgi:hypothetical protein